MKKELNLKTKNPSIIFQSENPAQTIQFSKKFSKKLKKGDILLLDGKFGAGKTIFVKGIAQGLGISEDVISPSFVYLNVYKNKNIKLYHFDVYRIVKPFDLLSIGITPEIFDSGIIVIEWGRKIKQNFDNYYEVKIKIKGNNKREIRIKFVNKKNEH